MSEDSARPDFACAVAVEGKRFGRNLSPLRASELAAELDGYEAAMERLGAPPVIDCDLSGFLEALVELAPAP